MPNETASDTKLPAELPPCWLVATAPDNGEGFQLRPTAPLPELPVNGSQGATITPQVAIRVTSILLPEGWIPGCAERNVRKAEIIGGRAQRWEIVPPIDVAAGAALEVVLHNLTGSPQRPRSPVLMNMPQLADQTLVEPTRAEVIEDVRRDLAAANKALMDACNRARIAHMDEWADQIFEAGHVTAALLAYGAARSAS